MFPYTVINKDINDRKIQVKQSCYLVARRSKTKIDGLNVQND